MTMIHLDVSSQTEQKAKSVLNSLGLTLDDAVNLLVSKIAHENRLPFADKTQAETESQWTWLDDMTKNGEADPSFAEAVQELRAVAVQSRDWQ